MSGQRGIVWLRRDLRLDDNPALDWASRHADELVLAYVHAPDEEDAWAPGAASRWWLHHSLAEFDRQLAGSGQRLVILPGPSLSALLGLAESLRVDFVCWNRLYEPAIVARDKEVKSALREQGVDARSFKGALLVEPWEVETAQGEPYRVFTPFWRACQSHLEQLTPALARPARLAAPARLPRTLSVDDLGLLPGIRWDTGLAATWQPGETGAHAALDRFISSAAADYGDGRNRPDQHSTSRLSPHLHFGEISPRRVLAAINGTEFRGRARDSAASFVRELGWREFAHHLLYHFPQTPTAPLDQRFAEYPWRDDAAAIEAWQRGATGYPIVDAGMRELWQTGWMHNRVRMIVASYLTKNLQVHWLEGARWFWDTLVDADLANNTLGWQWTAGCGADAAPYFRVFNPVLQAERHDPDRAYLRRWIPELAKLPDTWIHRPWEAPAEILASAGVELGTTYPRPLVDLRDSRSRALAGYQAIRKASS
ncbi:MAG TPA: deoxyribodipyrimidine photo-lyase [Steroidobacteraceae bacterium]|nr:deoxyribodipyrimidine photo-lyase [Steroidobacteraceae bacterium]